MNARSLTGFVLTCALAGLAVSACDANDENSSTQRPVLEGSNAKQEVSRHTTSAVTQQGQAWQSVVLSTGEVAHLGDPATVSQEKGNIGKARQANVAFILDASGSMNAQLPGTGKSKLVVAKEVLSEVIPKVPAEVNGALWIYGHRYPQEPKEKSCQDIERVFALGPVDACAYLQKIDAITAIGYTPIADNIEQAARDLPAGKFNNIILVSDGEETCGGDPCALTEALKASDASVTIHVVGYALKKEEREQLQCIARVSGGTYHDAEDAAGLLQALKDALAATVSETILRVEIVGPEEKKVNGNVHIYESGTDRKVSSFIAWKDNVVPPGKFDVIVDTLPWTLYRAISIEDGSTTLVRIQLGALRVLTPEGKETTFAIFDAESETRIGFYGGRLLLSPGSYYVNVKNISSDDFTINAGETVKLQLGALRVLSPDNKETTVDIFTTTGKRVGFYGGTSFLFPGSYQISKNNSLSEPIRIEASKTEELVLGAIKVLSPDKKRKSVNVYDAKGKRLGFYGDTILLVPGRYQVEIYKCMSEDIVLGEGKTVEVLLGSVQVEERFEIFDVSGKRMGSYKNSLDLLPGTYTLKLIQGPTFENVVVKAGEVTVVR